jgi:flagellar hook-length control protein FliK
MRANTTPDSRDRNAGDSPGTKRTPRRTTNGPIGFGQVFAFVRGEKRKSAAEELASVPTALLLDLQQLNGQLPQHLVLEEAQQQQLPARLTPQQALAATVRAARELADEEGMREIEIELEPAHLGPLVVQVKRTGKRLETTLTARNAEAVSVLQGGMNELAKRLASVSSAAVSVAVEHDEDLELVSKIPGNEHF